MCQKRCSFRHRYIKVKYRLIPGNRLVLTQIGRRIDEGLERIGVSNVIKLRFVLQTSFKHQPLLVLKYFYSGITYSVKPQILSTTLHRQIWNPGFPVKKSPNVSFCSCKILFLRVTAFSLNTLDLKKCVPVFISIHGCVGVCILRCVRQRFSDNMCEFIHWRWL